MSASDSSPNGMKNDLIVEETSPPPKKLSFLDTYLSLWILIACGVGLGLGQLDGMIDAISKTSVNGSNILVAIGLILMMFPPLVRTTQTTKHI
jgi:arsenite transporter